MAHCIHENDHMFSVRETPWHGLGTILQEVATASEAIQAAQLDWAVSKRPLRTTDGLDVPRAFATVREDTNEVLGVVGEFYTPLQNAEAFRFFDQVAQDPNGAKYHTAGSLHNGRKVWILAKLSSFVEVSDRDVVEEYLLLSNSHDGSSAISVLWTPVRVVCQNTLNAALGGPSKRFAHYHIGRVADRVNQAQDILGIARYAHDDFLENVTALRNIKPTKAQVDEVLAKLYPYPESEEQTPGLKAARTRTDGIRQQITDMFRTSETCTTKGAKNTGWGLYNALTEYSDHFRGGKPGDDAKVDRIWYGSAVGEKRDALTAVLALAK